MSELVVERLHGPALGGQLAALSRLRINVFREYPYLYDGSLEYEEAYLRGFAASPGSTLVVAREGDDVVGASTGVPLLEHGDNIALALPLRQAGFDPAHIYYFGESVLLPAYRGRGIGGRFMTLREQAAREQGFAIATFCAVSRPADHPARPIDYEPHDGFWIHRGFQRRADIIATFSWRDLGDPNETVKPMIFWIKELAP